MKKTYKDYPWIEIQHDYDNGLSLRDCMKKYNFGTSVYLSAKKYKLFITISSREGFIKYLKIHGPHPQTTKTKKKLSKIRRNYLQKNPDKVPYLLNHYSKKLSYSEKYFLQLIELEKINLKHHKQVGLYQLDFYNEDKKVYFEVDGEQHYVDKRIVESDIKRNAFLFNNGWVGARIRWSKYQKLQFAEKQNIICKLKQFIENANRNTSIIHLI